MGDGVKSRSIVLPLATLCVAFACGDGGGGSNGTGDGSGNDGQATTSTGDGGQTSSGASSSDSGTATGGTSDTGTTVSGTGGTSATGTTGGGTTSTNGTTGGGTTPSGTTTSDTTTSGTTTGEATTSAATTSAATTSAATTSATKTSVTTATSTTTTGTATGSLACPGSCGGCCVGESCLAGDTDAACGTGGTACEQCETHENCVTNACEIDPGYAWNLVVVSATISGVHDTGSPGSCGSTIVDGFVTVDLNGNAGTSDVEEETTTPVWNDLLITDSAAAFTGNLLAITVWDDDGAYACSPPDLIETCDHQVSEADLEARGFTLDFCGAQVTDLVFDLDPT